MIEFSILSSISALTIWISFWIGLGRLSFLPGAARLSYIIATLSGLSFKRNYSDYIIKQYGSIISRCVILMGLMVLLINQGLVRYHVTTILLIINILLYYSSYKRTYHEGKQLFVRGMIAVTLTSVGYTIAIGSHESIIRLLSLTTVICLGMLYSISYLFTLSEDDQILLSHQQELTLYTSVIIILYRVFAPDRSAVIVSNLWFMSSIIAIRQTYLRKKDDLSYEKKKSLTGRAILAGQRVLDRYEHRRQDVSLQFFDYLITHSYMPSSWSMPLLYSAQLIGIILVLFISIQGILGGESYTLIRYRLGIACFVITLFGISSEEKIIPYYKPIALALITGAYYITLFDLTQDPAVFVRGSTAWLSLNMIMAVFYREIFPQAHHILTRKDILFWLSMIIIGGIITILSLTRIALSGQILFALASIIIGLISFFSYHIWQRE